MWKPDQEEQQYCWVCANWFNTSCFKKHAQTQSSVAAEQKALNFYEGYAEIVVKVAFQPTARGGPRHFVSGNGHIVRHAREILKVVDADSHPPYVAHLLEAGGVPYSSGSTNVQLPQMSEYGIINKVGNDVDLLHSLSLHRLSDL